MIKGVNQIFLTKNDNPCHVAFRGIKPKLYLLCYTFCLLVFYFYLLIGSYFAYVETSIVITSLESFNFFFNNLNFYEIKVLLFNCKVFCILPWELNPSIVYGSIRKKLVLDVKK